MTGLVRKAILLTVGASFIAGVAAASTPSAANSSFPTTGILLVGRNAANTPNEDSAGEFSVTVKDATNTPIPGATVTVNFNACTPDIRVSRIQSFTGVSVICNGVLGVVSAQTNALGVATLRILGGAQNAGNSPGAAAACAEIRANGVFLSTVEAAAIDQTGGLNGALANDVSVVISDINNANPARRSDFNFSNSVLPNDLSVDIALVNSGRSSSNSAAISP
jgi:hypothetical protein